MFEINSNLQRYPKSDNLQAWDASDELILEELTNKEGLESLRILILGDSFGALTLALNHLNTVSYTDSYVSSKGMQLNGVKNSILSDLEKIQAPFDLVIIKLPKSHSFFEDLLIHSSHFLKQGGELIIGAMVKHLTNNIFEFIQKYVGETKTSLAKKKARLIFSTLSKAPAPFLYPQKVHLDVMKKDFIHHSNIFSRNKLDIGTRFFLEHIPAMNASRVLDLGCANGVIGIKAKLENPKAHIIFSDESYMAIKSAKENYQTYFQEEASYLWTNCYEEGKESELDLVLCNPPFHQNNIIGDFIAFQMFKDAKNGLKTGGKVRVIGNLHLGYQYKLKKIFGNSQIIAKNNKFMIIDAIKR